MSMLHYTNDKLNVRHSSRHTSTVNVANEELRYYCLDTSGRSLRSQLCQLWKKGQQHTYLTFRLRSSKHRHPKRTAVRKKKCKAISGVFPSGLVTVSAAHSRRRFIKSSPLAIIQKKLFGVPVQLRDISSPCTVDPSCNKTQGLEKNFSYISTVVHGLPCRDARLVGKCKKFHKWQLSRSLPQPGNSLPTHVLKVEKNLF